MHSVYGAQLILLALCQEYLVLYQDHFYPSGNNFKFDTQVQFKKLHVQFKNMSACLFAIPIFKLWIIFLFIQIRPFESN